VNLGKFVELPPNPSLQQPPKIENSDGNYDSVKGRVNDSEVYTVYSSSKAYPEYIISY